MSDPVCKCGAAVHPADAARCGSGHVLVGNAAARTHGVRAFEMRGPEALPAEMRQTVEDFRMQIIADRGGTDHLTAVEAAYIRRLSELEAVTRLLAGDLASKGLMTPRGRVRGVFGRWLETLDRWDKYAQRIGMERKARHVDTIVEIMREHTGPR